MSASWFNKKYTQTLDSRTFILQHMKVILATVFRASVKWVTLPEAMQDFDPQSGIQKNRI